MNGAFAHRGVTAIRLLPGGHRNAVWLVERGGAQFVAKTTDHSEAALRWLFPVLKAARSCGLNPPLLIADAAGRLATGGMTLEPFVEGVPPTRHDFLALAPRLAAFHSRLPRYPDRPGARPKAPANHCLRLARAIRRLGPERVVVHGDVTRSNLLVTASGPVLLDWDEARRDHPAFDLPLTNANPAIRKARLAREIVFGWRAEPDHARRLARSRQFD